MWVKFSSMGHAPYFNPKTPNLFPPQVNIRTQSINSNETDHPFHLYPIDTTCSSNSEASGSVAAFSFQQHRMDIPKVTR